VKLSQAYEGYRMDKLSEGYSPGTFSIYDWFFRELVTQLSDPELDAINIGDLRNFMFYLRVNYRTKAGTQLSGSSLDNAWKGIRSFFKWANLELGTARPDSNLTRPKFTSEEISPFTQEEAKKIVEALVYTNETQRKGQKAYRRKRETAERDRLLVALLLDTGIRISEACRLNVEDVDLGGAEIKIAAYGTGQKTKARTIPIGKTVKAAMWKYLANRNPEPHEPLFPATMSSLEPMERRAAHRIIHRAGERAGIEDAHPHRFRHTFAIEFLRNGGDIFTLRKILGHSTLAMVMRYLEFTQADLANVHKRSSPADRWRL
jgi:integrase/recombinase XerD